MKLGKCYTMNVYLSHKELKTKGHIGEVCHAVPISFISMETRINKAAEKGYDEFQKVHAIIQSIVTGVKLKRYLESGRERLYQVISCADTCRSRTLKNPQYNS